MYDVADSQIRHYYSIDPATLTDSEFETFYAAMIFNRRNELKDIEVTIHNALITVLEKVFPNGS